MSTLIRPGDRIVFVGDSITDGGRTRSDPTSLGDGYVRMVSDAIREERSSDDIDVSNRGVGGNRAVDLQARWDEDCISLKPTVVSLLVGVNDTWRRFDEGTATTPAAFERSVRDLLIRTRNALDVRWVLIEPFTLDVGYVTPEWRADLQPRIDLMRDLAHEYDAVLLAADELFAAWSERYPAVELLSDGVHPTTLGHRLLAEAWLEAAARA